MTCARGERTIVHQNTPDWRVHLVDTGLDTMTGGRIFNLRDMLRDGRFMMTYGDGVGDVDITALVALPPLAREARDGHRGAPAGPVRCDRARRRPSDAVRREASDRRRLDQRGVLRVRARRARLRISGPDTSLEREVLEQLTADGELMAYRHDGFFQPMDTLREKRQLEELWQSGQPPWLPHR